VLLPISAQSAQKISDELGAEPCVIKAGEYKFATQDTHSVCVGLSTVAHVNTDAQLIYNVTKGIVDNLEHYRAAHRLLKEAVTLERFTQKGRAPFHPGAEKYYRERGLLK
jgi:TRAP-type uncharacterized transport system substrate-binding protein